MEGQATDVHGARPRLLFFCQLNPWRLNSGGSIRNYWLLHALTERFDVDLITADDAAQAIPGDFRERCAGIYRFPEGHGLRAKLAKVRRGLRFKNTYFTSGVVTRKMQAAVAGMLSRRKHSLIVTELAFVDAFRSTEVPIVYASQNCEAELLLRRAKIEPPLLRIAMTIDALRLRRFEARLIERSAIVLACSVNDVQDMIALAPAVASKALIIPNGVNCAAYEEVAQAVGDRGTLLVTGSFDWAPNRRALVWFLHEVLPILDRLLAGKGAQIRIAGRMSPDVVKLLSEYPQVTAVPNVPRMDVELSKAIAVMVPVLASSGTRLRILEAWAAGRPVVTTPEGAFGLDFVDGTDLFSCSSPQQFAEAAARLLDDDALRERLHVAGLLRGALYDWSRITPKLITGLEEAGIIPANAAPSATSQASCFPTKEL